jgi:hypothetical protein
MILLLYPVSFLFLSFPYISFVAPHSDLLPDLVQTLILPDLAICAASVLSCRGSSNIESLSPWDRTEHVPDPWSALYCVLCS